MLFNGIVTSPYINKRFFTDWSKLMYIDWSKDRTNIFKHIQTRSTSICTYMRKVQKTTSWDVNVTVVYLGNTVFQHFRCKS